MPSRSRYRERDAGPFIRCRYPPGGRSHTAGPTNTRFSMAATLDSTRVIRNVSSLMDEIINHLTSIHGANMEIRLLVDATIPEGAPQGTVRTITENCKTLKVEDFGFDD